MLEIVTVDQLRQVHAAAKPDGAGSELDPSESQ
jgi:hypothetical protein